MKKKITLFFLVISCLFIKNVYAFDLGVSSTEDATGGAFSSSGSQTILIKPGLQSSLAVLYGDFHGDSENLGKIVVNINPAGLTIASNSNRLETGDTITGSGNSYTININSASSDYDGLGLFVLTIPSVTATTNYNVTMSATAFDKNGGQIGTKNINVKYVAVVKPTNCDNNSGASISTNAGTPTRIDGIMETYTLTTTNSSININVIRESDKSKVLYAKDCSFSSEAELPEMATVNNLALNIGSDNDACFIIQSECVQKSLNTTGDFIVGGTDWYDSTRYSPNLIMLNITRQDNRSKVNTLKDLTISDAKITFKSDQKDYEVTVPYKISSVKINSTLTDSKSSYVNGFGNRTVELKEGENNIQVKVKAENGDEAIYTIKITREKSDDATLKIIKIDNKEIKIKDKVLKYEEYVDNKTEKVTITAEPNDKNAKVEIDEIKELVEGNNKIKIVVTASNGKKLTYELNIIKDKSVSENAKIKNIVIKNHPIDFSSGIYDYTINLKGNEKQLDISVETDHPKAKFIINNNQKLKDGSIVEIVVTAEDGKNTNTYQLIIKKEKKFNFIILIIPVILALIGVVVYMLIKNNKTKIPPQEKANELPKENDIPINTETIERPTPLVQESSNDIPIKNINQPVIKEQPKPIGNPHTGVSNIPNDIPIKTASTPTINNQPTNPQNNPNNQNFW